MCVCILDSILRAGIPVPEAATGRVGTHMQSFPGEELDWWQQPQPTPEELRFSGGLRVEDWPHARQVERLSVQLFEATKEASRARSETDAGNRGSE